MAGKKAETIELVKINPRTARVLIEGDSDLVLNKMNDVAVATLTSTQTGETNKITLTEEEKKWLGIITSMHWLEKKPIDDLSEEGYIKALEENTVCLSAFGLKKSFCQAVTRNKISTYSTEFDATMNVVGSGDNLVPIKYAKHYLDTKMMSPKRGRPVVTYLNRFSGWSAEIQINFLENVYSLEQIVNIINLAGFGIGIGSGRSSGFGRYHVADVK